MKFTKLLVAAGIALSVLGAQAQNLVINGSFEETVTAGTPGQAPGTWTVYKSIVGWTGMPNIEVRDKVAGTAQDGGNFVELDTHGTKYSTITNSSMYQDILGTGLVNLSFYYSARPGVAAGSNNLKVTFGSFEDTVLDGVAGGSKNNWIHYTLNNFMLDSDGSTRLMFSATGVQDTYGGSLDNVSVTAVPEAETYAMMLAGLGLMGSIVRRRKAKNA